MIYIIKYTIYSTIYLRWGIGIVYVKQKIVYRILYAILLLSLKKIAKKKKNLWCSNSQLFSCGKKRYIIKC